MKLLRPIILTLVLVFSVNTATAAILYTYSGLWTRAVQGPGNGGLSFFYQTSWEGRLVLDTTEADILAGTYDPSSILSYFEVNSPLAGSFILSDFSIPTSVTFFRGSLGINGIEFNSPSFAFGWTPGIALLTDYIPQNDIFGTATPVGYAGSGPLSVPGAPFINEWAYRGSISTVPLPPAAFLMGSALLALFGFNRKKRNGFFYKK